MQIAIICSFRDSQWVRQEAVLLIGEKGMYSSQETKLAITVWLQKCLDGELADYTMERKRIVWKGWW